MYTTRAFGTAKCMYPRLSRCPYNSGRPEKGLHCIQCTQANIFHYSAEVLHPVRCHAPLDCNPLRHVAGVTGVDVHVQLPERGEGGEESEGVEGVTCVRVWRSRA